jgi:hypothetical protein
MRIGILTFHDGFNYGAFLQAWNLQNTLASLGHEPVVLNYKNRRHFVAEYRCFLWVRRPPLLVSNVRKIFGFWKVQRRLSTNAFSFNVRNVLKGMDAVVVGADEVWNYQNPLFGYDGAYFGNGIEGCPLVSYAPSFGPREADALVPENAVRGLRRFSHISVRDANSQEVIRRVCGSVPPMVCDPTLLAEIALPLPKTDGQYILYYGTTDIEEWAKDEIKAFAREMKLPLRAAAYPVPWCDSSHIGCDVWGFLELMRKARFVVTTMFHGTIFASRYGKQFATITTPYRLHKLNGMVQRLGLEERLVTMPGELKGTLLRVWSFDDYAERLAAWRMESLSFLRKALR